MYARTKGSIESVYLDWAEYMLVRQCDKFKKKCAGSLITGNIVPDPERVQGFA